MILLFVMGLFFLFPQSSNAQVIINEVYPHPNNQENEWVEIFNPSNQDIDLNNWFLEDLLSTPQTIFEIKDIIITQNSFFTIELSSAKLNNSADGVILKNSDGEIVDSMEYQSSLLGKSWSKNKNDDFLLNEPSKNKENIFPQPSPSIQITPTSIISPMPDNTDLFEDKILITEFSACPNANKDEWVEIYNSDDDEHSLSNWQITDQSNKTKNISMTIAPHEYKIFSWNDSLLNNSGESFYLKNQFQENLQEITYPACQHQASFILLNDRWVETQTPTPESENLFEPFIATNLPATNILEANENFLVANDINQIKISSSSPTIKIPKNRIEAPSKVKITIDSVNIPKESKLVHIYSPKFPKKTLMSVILGGSIELIIGIWKIYEKK